MSKVIALQGINGAYSEQAVRQHFGESAKVLPCDNLDVMFDVLHTDKAAFGMLPAENSTAGAVPQSYELLMDYDFRIQAEVILPIHHCLMAVPGTTLEDLECVRSHPMALAQCSRFLKSNNLKPIPWYDTAGSALDLSKEKPAKTAAIASRLAAELYGLDIIAADIEDLSFNYTRFLVLGKNDAERGDYNKTSLVFATRNRPSALYDCLGEFAKREINLTKIESRPRRNRPWEPVFYLDFEGHWQDEACKEAVTALLQQASFVKMLGSYPAVKTDSVGI